MIKADTALSVKHQAVGSHAMHLETAFLFPQIQNVSLWTSSNPRLLYRHMEVIGSVLSIM